MKQSTVLVIFLSLLALPLYATHNRAGEIIYRQVGPNRIEASIITFTKTSSRPADRDSLELCWGDGSCERIARTNNQGDSVGPDVQRNVYTAVHR